MRILAITFFACCFSVVAVGDSNQASSRTWITNVTIISPEKLEHIEKGSVLIDNGHIVSVERKKGAKKPAGARVVSGKGQFLIPGLIDSHVHLASIPGMSFDQSETKKEMFKHYFQQLPRSYLYYGYTTLVDLAVLDQQIMADFRQAPLHPDLYDCGESLPLANGYPMSFAPAAVRFKMFPNFIYDPAQAATIPAEYKPEDHTPAADVAKIKASGGICVKTYFERGFGRDRNLPVMDPKVLDEVRKAASQAGLVLMMHANSFEAQQFGVKGNVDVLAHGMWNWGNLDQKTELPDEIKKLLDQIVEKRTGYQPTMQVIEGLAAYFDPEYLKLGAIPKVVPGNMLRWFNSAEGQWFKKELDDDNTPDPAVLKGIDGGVMRRVRRVVGYLASKDANFVFGTDTPSSPTYGNLPGLNGYLEMQQLRKAGMSLAQIFKAATINNAREFKIDSQVGTIEPGKVANLILLRKSPLETVDAYDSVVTVWVHGEPASRDSLAVTSENSSLPQNAAAQKQPRGPSLSKLGLPSPDKLELHNVKAESVTYLGRDAVRIKDAGAANLDDAGRFAIVRGTEFQDGVIEVDLSGDTAPDAPPEFRGFVGITFRVSTDRSHFECFYLRPKNGRSENQLQRNHSVQYISVPGFPWQKLRSESPGKYESYVDLVPGQWTKVRIEVSGTNARLYVNGAEQPTLIVTDLKQPIAKGAVALWVGVGTIAHFSHLKVAQ